MSTNALTHEPGPPGGAAVLRSRLTHPGRLRRWVSPVGILLGWQLLSSAGILPGDVLASPLQIAETAAALTDAGTLQQATLVSVQRVAAGFLVGAPLGVTLAVVAGLSRIGADAVDPPMQVLRTLPHVALVPLFVVWMGLGELPKVALIAVGVALPLYVHTLAGIRGVDPRLADATRSLHFTRAQRLRHVVLPGALPQTLVGLRLSLGVAWLSLVVAETVSPDAGLGQLVDDAREHLRTDVIVVGLVVYGLLVLLTDGAVRLVERKTLSWR